MSNCSKCCKNYELNDCEEYFESKLCQDCRISLRGLSKVSERKDLWNKNIIASKLWSRENLPMLPTDVHGGSNSKYYFHCDNCSKIIYSTVANFTRKTATQQCNNCSNKSRGAKNSLPKGLKVSDSDYLLSIWNYEKNKDIFPENFAINSNKKVWWRCDKGHETFTNISNRSNGRGCGVCMEKYYVSKAEKDLLNFIKSIYGGEVLENKKAPNYPYESDIYVPEFNLIVDFNGDYWHSEKIISEKKNMSAYDWHILRKDNALRKGNLLVYVWEGDWSKRRREVEYALKKIIFFGEVDEMLGIMGK